LYSDSLHVFVHESNLYISLAFLVLFFNYSATTEISTLSLHDALPILALRSAMAWIGPRLPSSSGTNGASGRWFFSIASACMGMSDRKSTRLNSSHVKISYAVFCLKKKTKTLYMYSIHNQINMYLLFL